MVERNDQLNQYRELLAELPVDLLKVPEDVLSSAHLAVIRLREVTAEKHRYVFEGLRADGIGTTPLTARCICSLTTGHWASLMVIFPKLRHTPPTR